MWSLLLFLFLLFYFDYCYFSVHDIFIIIRFFVFSWTTVCLVWGDFSIDTNKKKVRTHRFADWGVLVFSTMESNSPSTEKKKKTKIMDLVIILLIAFEH